MDLAFVARVFAQSGPAATTTTLPEPPPTVCPGDTSWVCRSVYRRLGAELGEEWAPRFEWLVAKPLTIGFILLVAFMVNRVARYAIKRAMNQLLEPPSERTRRAQRALRRAAPAALLKTSALNLRLEARVQTLTTVFRSITSVIIWFTAGFTCLQVLGVNLTGLVAVSTVIGAAVGFGAQNIVRDFLAGMFIVLEDQFGVGDTVDVGNNAKGTVEELTLRCTKVRDVHGTLWHVPNGQIQQVANKSQAWARAVLDVEVDGGTDYDTAARVIDEVAVALAGEEQWMVDVLGTPEVWGVEAFTEQGYTIRLVLKTRPASQFGVLRELRIRILAAFAARGILLPGGHWSVEHGTEVDAAAGARGAEAAAGHAGAVGGAPPAEPPKPAPSGRGGRGAQAAATKAAATKAAATGKEKGKAAARSRKAAAGATDPGGAVIGNGPVVDDEVGFDAAVAALNGLGPGADNGAGPLPPVSVPVVEERAPASRSKAPRANDHSTTSTSAIPDTGDTDQETGIAGAVDPPADVAAGTGDGPAEPTLGADPDPRAPHPERGDRREA